MATLDRIDGFEHGNTAAAAGGVYGGFSGAPVNVTTPVRTGNRALEISMAGVTEDIGYTGFASTIIATGFYLRFATIPSALVKLCRFLNANGSGYLRINSSGQLSIIAGAGSAQNLGSPLSTNTWYRIVLEYDTSTGTATFRGKVDNGTEATATNAQVSANITELKLGTDAAVTYTAYFDDWIISITDGDYEEIGGWASHSVEGLLPTADGAHNTVGANELEYTGTGTDITDASTDVWTLVDDVPLDTALSDYVNDVGTSATAYVEVTFADLAAGTDEPQAVRAYGVDADSTGTGTSAAISRVLLSDNTALSPDLRLSTDDPGITTTVRKKMLTAPGGGWTRTNVNGLKARMGFGDGAPDVRFSSFMLEVALRPAAAAVLPPGPTIVNTAVDRSYTY